MYTPTVSLPHEFDGVRALVTGGSRGIGAAIAQRLLDGGAAVVTTARSFTDDTPGASTFIAADVSAAAGVQLLMDQALDTLGGLDVLINNAGASQVHMGGASTIPDEEWQQSLNINFLSAVRLLNAALPALKESGRGAVVNIAATGALTAPPPLLHYATAKAALLVYGQGMAKELAASGIRLNSVTPGSVRTPGGTAVLQTIADAVGAPEDAITANIPWAGWATHGTSPRSSHSSVLLARNGSPVRTSSSPAASKAHDKPQERRGSMRRSGSRGQPVVLT